jgi:hypothetical protein
MPDDILMTPLTQAELDDARKRRADAALAEKTRKNTAIKRKTRAAEKAAKALLEPVEPLSQMWLRNSEALKKSDPTLYAQLEQIHLDVEATTREVDEQVRSIKTGNVPDILPDVIYAELRDQQTLNYGGLEGMHERNIEGDRVNSFRPTKAEKFSNSIDDAIGAYRHYGFRCRITDEIRRDALDNLLLFWLRNPDTNVDGNVIAQAIRDFHDNRGWFYNHKEIEAGLKAREAVIVTGPQMFNS